MHFFIEKKRYKYIYVQVYKGSAERWLFLNT